MVLWSQNHVKTLLPSFIVMLILAIALKLWLGKKDDKIRIIPLQIITIILLVLEVFKQVISIIKGYDLYHIPLHFCSLFLFLFPLMSFYKGKFKDQVRAIATTISASLFLLMTIYPELIYGGSSIENAFKNFFDFHTVAFHTVATFGFFVIVALKLHTPSFKRDMKAIILFFIGYSIVAGVTSQILQTNYNNFYQCNVPPLEELRLSILAVLGRPLTQTLYVLIVTIVDLVFVTISYNLYRLLIFIIDKIKCKKALS